MQAVVAKIKDARTPNSFSRDSVAVLSGSVSVNNPLLFFNLGISPSSGLHAFTRCHSLAGICFCVLPPPSRATHHGSWSVFAVPFPPACLANTETHYVFGIYFFPPPHLAIKLWSKTRFKRELGKHQAMLVSSRHQIRAKSFTSGMNVFKL